MVASLFLAPCIVMISSASFSCTASVSRFWVFWIRNTIRKVTIVVAVLITSCQVSLKPNSGPITAQRSRATRDRKVSG